MDWLTFISSMTTALIWPFTVILIIIILKSPISQLILSIEEITGKNLGVRFKNKVAKLNSKVDLAIEHRKPEGDLNLLQNVRFRDDYKNFYNEAFYNSRSAVISAWLIIEESIRDLAKRKEIKTKYYQPTINTLNELLKKNLISKDIYVIIDSARKLRNEAVHGKIFTISPEDAQDYISTANKITSYLDLLN